MLGNAKRGCGANVRLAVFNQHDCVAIFRQTVLAQKFLPNLGLQGGKAELLPWITVNDELH